MARSLRILAHPVVLLAVGLVALNDFWLKAAYPSWLTGKLSDVGMLAALPLLLAGLLSAIVNRRWAGALGLGLTAGGFILLKAGAQSAAWLGGLHLRSIPDPSDLLALPALAIPAWLWFRTPEGAPRAPARWQYLLLPLAGMVLLADAAMPDRGINCLYTQEGQLRAVGGYFRVYASGDGGRTWRLTDEEHSTNECGIPQDAQEALVRAPDGSTAYRIEKNASVERSTDNGATWQALDLREPISQAEETYIRKTRSGNLVFEGAPLDALIDPESGNLVLAMGQEGVVLVKADGSWEAKAVGPYARDSLKSAGAGGYFTLLSGELIFAGLAGLAWLGTAGLRGRRGAWRVVTVIAWLALLGSALALHPEIADNSYTGMIPALGLIVSAGLALALLVGAAVARKAGLLRKLPTALLVSAVVILPYVLWGLAILPYYWIAALPAAGLTMAAAVWVK